MASTSDLEENLAKMQRLFNAAQNEVQKRTFQDIIDNLIKRLESENSKLNSTKTEEPKTGEEDGDLPPKQDFFQGIGTLYGRIVRRHEDGDTYYNLISEERTYELIYNSPRMKEFLRLDYNPEKDRYITVYPCLTHFPSKSTPPKLAFTIVAANDTPYLNLKVNEFKLSGLWQFIAVCKCPVISIYRNRRGENDRVARIKKKIDNEKLRRRITKVNHIPVLWNAPVKPFRFNPKLDRKKQGDRYFCQVKARFFSDKGMWRFSELLAEPTLDIPRFHKPEKVSIIEPA